VSFTSVAIASISGAATTSPIPATAIFRRRREPSGAAGANWTRNEGRDRRVESVVSVA